MEQTIVEALEHGATVVTANQRLARHLAARYAAVQWGRGAQVWETPDVLPWPAWLARAWASWFDGASNPDASPLFLLGPEQEQALWEAAILDCESDNARLDVSAAASLAREAWGLWHAWRLPLKRAQAYYSQDTQAFLKWAAAFKTRCKAEQLIDDARLADNVADGVFTGRLPVPSKLLLAGFDELTQQQQEVLQALRDRGCDVIVLDTPAHQVGQAVRIGALDTEQEITLAARWARARIENSFSARIGIIVPELDQIRGCIARIFEDIFYPDAVLKVAHGPRAFNISLGLPLSDHPVIHTALSLLDLARGPVALVRMGNILRSPFLGGAELEWSRRALLDVKLREIGELNVDLRLLSRCAGAKDIDGHPRSYACEYLAGMLHAFERITKSLPARQSASAWAQTFAQLLSALGWPGERTQNSEEFQAVQAWRSALRALTYLDRVTMEMTLTEALNRLRRVAQTPFQSASSDAPVQVLGMLEAAGAMFDHLWLLGLQDEVWPSAAHPNPLLPIATQRAHQVPHASAQRELEYARKVTNRLLRSAPEVIASYPKRDGDRDLYPSPLIAGLAEVQPHELSVYTGNSWPNVIHRSADIETLRDDSAPALEEGVRVVGGTRLLEDQAACPFRAFATHRLGARPIEEAGPGLDPMSRGTLVHRALETIWSQLKSHQRLCAHTADQLGDLVRVAVAQTVNELRQDRGESFPERFFLMEQERLERLLMAWLELEKRRAPFEVVALEQIQDIEIGGLSLRTRIDRIDRLTDGGARVIVDYKTGKPAPPAWFDDRLEQSQLPLYSVCGESQERPAAVLLAHVRQGDLRYQGIAAQDGLAPGLRALLDTGAGRNCGSWDAIFVTWQQALEALAGEIRSGRATIDPKKFPATCQCCALPTLCRVHELFTDPTADAEYERG